MRVDLADMSIVVVDDHVDSAELLELLLAGNGARVRLAHTGESALALLETVEADVLLLDISLPDMDGYELLGKIRKNSRFADVPAVAMTGYAGERDKKKALEAGFAVHTSKPIDSEALLTLLSTIAHAPPSLSADPALAEVRDVLRAKGVFEVLRLLNTRTAHRYTALYRYEGPTLCSIALFDREDPSTTKGGDVPVETTFCSIVARDRASFATAEGTKDARVAGLPLREDVAAYCGTLLRNLDGTPFGSLCHFDKVSRPVKPEEVVFLEHVAPVLARELALESS